MSITCSFVLQVLILSLMLSSCDSVSSRRAFSRFVIWLNTCSGDDDDLQAEQTAKSNHGVSHTYGWMNRFLHVYIACQFPL